MLQQINEDESSTFGQLLQLLQSKYIEQPCNKYDWLSAQLSLISNYKSNESALSALLQYYTVAKDLKIPGFYTYFTISALSSVVLDLTKLIKQMKDGTTSYDQITHLISLRELLLSKVLSGINKGNKEHQKHQSYQSHKLNSHQTATQSGIDDLRFLTIELVKKINAWRQQNSNSALIPFFLDRNNQIYLLKLFQDNEAIISAQSTKYLSCPNPFFQSSALTNELFEHKIQSDISFCLQVLANEKAHQLKNIIKMGQWYKPDRSNIQKETSSRFKPVQIHLARTSKIKDSNLASKTNLKQLIREKEIAMLKDMIKKPVGKHNMLASGYKRQQNKGQDKEQYKGYVTVQTYHSKIEELKNKVKNKQEKKNKISGKQNNNQQNQKQSDMNQQSLSKIKKSLVRYSSLVRQVPPKIRLIEQKNSFVKEDPKEEQKPKLLSTYQGGFYKTETKQSRIELKKQSEIEAKQEKKNKQKQIKGSRVTRLSLHHDEIDQSLRLVTSRLKEEKIKSIYSSRMSFKQLTHSHLMQKTTSIAKLPASNARKVQTTIDWAAQKQKMRANIQQKIASKSGASIQAALPSIIPSKIKPKDQLKEKIQHQELKKKLLQEETKYLKLKQAQYAIRENQIISKHKRQISLMEEEQLKRRRELEEKVMLQKKKAENAQKLLKEKFKESEQIKKKLEENVLKEILYKQVMAEQIKEEEKKQQGRKKQIQQMIQIQQQYRRNIEKKTDERMQKEKQQIEQIYRQMKNKNKEIEQNIKKRQQQIQKIKYEQQQQQLKIQKIKEEIYSSLRNEQQKIEEVLEIVPTTHNNPQELKQLRQKVKMQIMAQIQDRRRREEQQERAYEKMQKEKMRMLQEQIRIALKKEEEQMNQIEIQYAQKHAKLTADVIRKYQIKESVNKSIQAELTLHSVHYQQNNSQNKLNNISIDSKIIISQDKQIQSQNKIANQINQNLQTNQNKQIDAKQNLPNQTIKESVIVIKQQQQKQMKQVQLQPKQVVVSKDTSQRKQQKIQQNKQKQEQKYKIQRKEVKLQPRQVQQEQMQQKYKCLLKQFPPKPTRQLRVLSSEIEEYIEKVFAGERGEGMAYSRQEVARVFEQRRADIFQEDTFGWVDGTKYVLVGGNYAVIPYVAAKYGVSQVEQTHLFTKNNLAQKQLHVRLLKLLSNTCYVFQKKTKQQGVFTIKYLWKIPNPVPISNNAYNIHIIIHNNIKNNNTNQINNLQINTSKNNTNQINANQNIVNKFNDNSNTINIGQQSKNQTNTINNNLDNNKKTQSIEWWQSLPELLSSNAAPIQNEFLNFEITKDKIELQMSLPIKNILIGSPPEPYFLLSQCFAHNNAYIYKVNENYAYVLFRQIKQMNVKVQNNVYPKIQMLNLSQMYSKCEVAFPLLDNGHGKSMKNIKTYFRNKQTIAYHYEQRMQQHISSKSIIQDRLHKRNIVYLQHPFVFRVYQIVKPNTLNRCIYEWRHRSE